MAEVCRINIFIQIIRGKRQVMAGRSSVGSDQTIVQLRSARLWCSTFLCFTPSRTYFVRKHGSQIHRFRIVSAIARSQTRPALLVLPFMTALLLPKLAWQLVQSSFSPEYIVNAKLWRNVNRKMYGFLFTS